MLLAPVLVVLVSFWVKSAAVLAVATLACRFLRRLGPSYRHLIWRLAFAAILALPLLQFALPRLQVEVLPSQAAPVQRQILYEPGVGPLITADGIGLANGTGAEPEEPLRPVPFVRARPETESSAWGIALAGTWLAGLLVLLARHFGSIWLLGRAAAKQADFSDGFTHLAERAGVRRRWQLVFGPVLSVSGPLTLGTARPIVLLPAISDRWAAERLESVLIHELVHVKRLDCLTQSIAMVACALNWVNPAVWLCLRALQTEAECSTDEAVLLTGVKPSDYADALLRIAIDQRRLPLLFTGASLMTKSQLASRVRAVLTHQSRPLFVSRTGAIAAIAVSILIAAPCAVIYAAPAQAQVPARAEHVTPKATNPRGSRSIRPRPATAIRPRRNAPGGQERRLNEALMQVQRLKRAVLEQSQGIAAQRKAIAMQQRMLAVQMAQVARMTAMTRAQMDAARRNGADRLAPRALAIQPAASSDRYRASRNDALARAAPARSDSLDKIRRDALVESADARNLTIQGAPADAVRMAIRAPRLRSLASIGALGHDHSMLLRDSIDLQANLTIRYELQKELAATYARERELCKQISDLKRRVHRLPNR